MKYCIRVPRMFIPRDGFEAWAVLARDRSPDKEYWQRVERTVGNSPSALRFSLPEIPPEEDSAEKIETIRENMYAALEKGWIEKLNRGLMLIERTGKPYPMYGILGCIDLEQYSYERGVESVVRPAEEVDLRRLPLRIAARAQTPLEFPHARVFYEDKRGHIVKALLKEDLEVVYSFPLMEGGGELTGRFIPDDYAVEVADALHTRKTPCFAVVDGNEDIAAAKEHWEAVKKGLTEEQKEMHPARFALVEFVNVYDEAPRLLPLHRFLRDVDAEAFASFYMKRVKSSLKGGKLYCKVRDAVDGIRQTDEIIAEFLRRNGGRVEYVRPSAISRCENEEDSVLVIMKEFEKEDIFFYLKGGRLLPAHTFVLGEEEEARYYFEGREIGYD